jgi:virulence-associated protein VapD
MVEIKKLGEKMETMQENVKKVRMTSYEDEEDMESVIKKKRSSLVKRAKKETHYTK